VQEFPGKSSKWAVQESGVAEKDGEVKRAVAEHAARSVSASLTLLSKVALSYTI
jgi:hypothetical protein